MFKGKSYLGIVPARGGSKGLPGKNIKDLCGEPLIAWSINAGLGCEYIDELMVTTDSREIADVAERFGAKVPFLRPKELATDVSTSFSVIEHAVEFYKNELGKKFDYIVLLEPTSPLRDKRDVYNSIEQLSEHPKASAIVGICKTEGQNPAFLVKKKSDDFLVGYENEDMRVLRRQDIQDVFFLEGSIYICQTDVYLDKKTFYHGGTIGYEVPKWKSLEVDDEYDMVTAEAIMRHNGVKNIGMPK
ncbi:MAG: acylneuraminate cytidylyltransferase family protein [Nitrospinae bacterium]|nr:acylneuraminate cytidylyltransferase family protein [Nitrospinota bacterium]